MSAEVEPVGELAPALELLVNAAVALGRMGRPITAVAIADAIGTPPFVVTSLVRVTDLDRPPPSPERRAYLATRRTAVPCPRCGEHQTRRVYAGARTWELSCEACGWRGPVPCTTDRL